MPRDLESWLEANGYKDGVQRTPVLGGCISQAWLVQARDGKQIFVKYCDDVQPGFYEAEAVGLEYLRLACNLRVPDVLGYGEHFIAMEYIASAPHQKNFWETLGHQLAYLHNCTREDFGFLNDNYCGKTLQPNTFNPDGYAFFGSLRLRYQADLALSSRKLTPQDRDDIEHICRRLPELIPIQPSSLLHGDLWSGNIHVSSDGEPVFIDPAVYFSWAEIDIAMTQLFGGFPQRFYDAYQEIRPMEKGWASRLEIYNLYPLLNHLNLFGEGYLESVRAILARYR